MVRQQRWLLSLFFGVVAVSGAAFSSYEQWLSAYSSFKRYDEIACGLRQHLASLCSATLWNQISPVIIHISPDRPSCIIKQSMNTVLKLTDGSGAPQETVHRVLAELTTFAITVRGVRFLVVLLDKIMREESLWVSYAEHPPLFYSKNSLSSWLRYEDEVKHHLVVLHEMKEEILSLFVKSMKVLCSREISLSPGKEAFAVMVTPSGNFAIETRCALLAEQYAAIERRYRAYTEEEKERYKKHLFLLGSAALVSSGLAMWLYGDKISEYGKRFLANVVKWSYRGFCKPLIGIGELFFKREEPGIVVPTDVCVTALQNSLIAKVESRLGQSLSSRDKHAWLGAAAVGDVQALYGIYSRIRVSSSWYNPAYAYEFLKVVGFSLQFFYRCMREGYQHIRLNFDRRIDENSPVIAMMEALPFYAALGLVSAVGYGVYHYLPFRAPHQRYVKSLSQLDVFEVGSMHDDEIIFAWYTYLLEFLRQENNTVMNHSTLYIFRKDLSLAEKGTLPEVRFRRICCTAQRLLSDLL